MSEMCYIPHANGGQWHCLKKKPSDAEEAEFTLCMIGLFALLLIVAVVLAIIACAT